MNKELIVQEKATLTEYSNNLPAQLSVCELLLKSGMLPSHLKTPAAVFMIIRTGEEYGFSPLRSVNMFDFINGRVSPRSAALQSIAQANGGKFTVINSSNDSLTVRAERSNGWKEECTFSMADAKSAGLGGNNWQKYPKDMMYARCVARLCRHGWADIIGGLNSVEEQEDAIQSASVEVVQTEEQEDAHVFTYNLQLIEDEKRRSQAVMWAMSKGAVQIDNGMWQSSERIKKLDNYQLGAIKPETKAPLLPSEERHKSAAQVQEWDEKKFLETPVEEMI